MIDVNRLYWVVVILCIVLTPLAAQVEYTETFIAIDGTWQFNYPDGWTIVSNEETSVTISDSQTALVFFRPTVSEALNTENFSSMAESLSSMLQMTVINSEVFGERSNPYAVTTLDDEGENVYAVIQQLENKTFGVVLIVFSTVPTEEEFERFTQIALTMKAVRPEALQINSYNMGRAEIIAELEAKGIIQRGGDRVFEEDYAFFSGQGSFFTPLAQNAPHTDLIMAGELTFSVGNPTIYESCTLISRVVTNEDGVTEQYLEFGIDNEGDAFYYDSRGLDRDNPYEYTPIQSYNFDRPVHFIAIVKGNQLELYVDGRRLLSNNNLEVRTGTYGVALIGHGPLARCEGRNIWVYKIPGTAPGECQISSPNIVNKRTGPGTNFDINGQLETGTVTNAVGQARGASGFRWWLLEDGTWVREDVVEAKGDCNALPLRSTP